MAKKEGNKSGWVSIVAVLGIIMGSLGIIGGIQFAVMPKIYKMQKEMMPEMMKTLQKQQDASPAIDGEALGDTYKKMMDKMLNLPPWYDAFSYISGGFGVIIGAFYLYASIMLLQRKKTALKMFLGAVIASMIFVLLRGAGLAMSQSFYAVSSLVGSFFSLVVNGVILAVSLNGDKSGLTE